MILSSGVSAGFAIWLPSVLALVGYAVAAVLNERSQPWARPMLIGAWLLHAVAIVADVAGWGATSGAGARFGFAPAVSATTWLVLGVYAVESRFVPLTPVRRSLAVLGAAAVLLAMAYPGEFRPHASSPWAPLHWALGIASYGMFGAAVLHAAMLDAAERQMRAKKAGVRVPVLPAMPLLRLERLTFQFVVAGFALLSATLVLGWWFADPWRWDHKAVFSVLGWGVFAALLLGRRLMGWRGRSAVRWVYAGALLLLLAYVGSRFVLEVVLQRPVL
jgi:ABC-type uncharacterized transport system permease subunit